MDCSIMCAMDAAVHSESDKLRVSVAISTFGRRDRISTLITMLERQTLGCDRFEVIVTDDGSRDDTFEVLQRIAESSPVNLRVLRKNTSTGPASGRNLAWRAAVAPIVAFTDDDCAPAQDWLEAGVRRMDAGVDIVVGKTTPNPEQLHLLGPFSRTMNTTDERYFATCNIFYRRADLQAVGGFDEGFTNPGGEDTDLAYRVRRIGRHALFAPEVLVHHDVRPPSFRASVREALRWEGIVRLVARNPNEARREHLWRPYVWKDTHLWVILATIGITLGLVFPLSLALTIPYLRMRLRASTWRGRVRRALILPGLYAIDMLEVYVMLKASIKYRTLVL